MASAPLLHASTTYVGGATSTWWVWTPPAWVPEGLALHVWPVAAAVMLPLLVALALTPRQARWKQADRRASLIFAALCFQVYALLLAACVLTVWPCPVGVIVTVFTLGCTTMCWQGLRLTRSRPVVMLGVSLCLLGTLYLTAAWGSGQASNRFSLLTTVMCGFAFYLAGIAVLHGLGRPRFTAVLVALAACSGIVALRLAYLQATTAAWGMVGLAVVTLVTAWGWRLGRRQWALGLVSAGFVSASLALAMTGRQVSSVTAGLGAGATLMSMLAHRRHTAGSAALSLLAWAMALMVLTVQYLWVSTSILVMPLALVAAGAGIIGSAMLIYGEDRLGQHSATALVNLTLDWFSTAPSAASREPSQPDQDATTASANPNPGHVIQPVQDGDPNHVIDLAARERHTRGALQAPTI